MNYLLTYIVKLNYEKITIMRENTISHQIIGCAIKVHSELGPGLLESAYAECLNYELQLTGLKVRKQKPLPLVYHDVRLDVGYRLDLFVEDCVVVEIKAVDAYCELHFSQVLTYLKFSQCKLGLLLNFNVVSMKDGIKRIVHGL
jgi:GxxExxY protein